MPRRQAALLLAMARLGGLAVMLAVVLGAPIPVTATPGATIGTSDPLAGSMLPAHGRWFVVCQARTDTNGDGKVDATFDGRHAEGDRYLPYLVIGTGDGIEIDHVAAKSDDGRWLAVVRGGKLELRDTTRGTTVGLAADVRYDDEWPHRHEPRFASIGPGGTYMTYLTTDAIVIRELASGSERKVRVTGTLWRAEVERGERWAKVRVLRRDTNRDGKLAWTTRLGSWMYGCTSDTLHRGWSTERIDEPTVLWLELATGKLIEDPTVIGSLGEDLLRRRPDGALVLGSTVVAPPACRGRVAATLDQPARAAINCGTARDASGHRDHPVFVVGPKGFRKDTTFDMHYGDDDGFSWDVYAGERYRNTYEGRSLDLATGEVIAIPGDIAGYDDRLVLIRTPRGHAVFDLATRIQTVLAGSPTTETHPTDLRDELVRVGDRQWDAVTGAPIAPLDVRRRLADGRYVVARRGPRGPLAIVKP